MRESPPKSPIIGYLYPPAPIALWDNYLATMYSEERTMIGIYDLNSPSIIDDVSIDRRFIRTIKNIPT